MMIVAQDITPSLWLHKRIKNHIHTHIHRHVHHVSHALAYHFETLYISFVMIVFSFAFLGNSLFAATPLTLKKNTSLIYPLKKVSTFACRQLMKPRSELEDKCKVALPIIKWWDYLNYKDNIEYKNIYTVLWWATYWGQRDMDKGDHAGVDIASANGTPLYAVAHGIVTFAGTQAWYGNVVKIMFRYNGVTYHAVYWHMNSIAVSKWDIVEQWQLVWEVWNSWSTFGALWGNHVHFEIDKDNAWRPAFYYQWCPALDTKSFTEITNGGLCREYREKYSYDPIAFIESTKMWIEVAIIDNHTVAPTKPIVVTDTIQKLSPSFLSLNTLKSYKLTKDALVFIQDQDIQLVANYNKKMNLWQQWTISLYITKKWSAKKFNGALSTDISFVSSDGGTSLSQQSVQYVTKWLHTISFTTKKLGKTMIAITLWWQTLASFSIEVIQ